MDETEKNNGAFPAYAKGSTEPHPDAQTFLSADDEFAVRMMIEAMQASAEADAAAEASNASSEPPPPPVQPESPPPPAAPFAELDIDAPAQNPTPPEKERRKKKREKARRTPPPEPAPKPAPDKADAKASRKSSGRPEPDEAKLLAAKRAEEEAQKRREALAAKRAEEEARRRDLAAKRAEEAQKRREALAAKRIAAEKRKAELAVRRAAEEKARAAEREKQKQARLKRSIERRKRRRERAEANAVRLQKFSVSLRAALKTASAKAWTAARYIAGVLARLIAAAAHRIADAARRIDPRALRRRLPYIGAGVAVVLLLSFGIWFVYGKSTVYPGLNVMGTDVSGLNAEEIAEVLDCLNRDDFSGRTLRIVCGGEEYLLPAEQIGLAYRTDAVADDLLAYGRSGSLFTRLGAIFSAMRHGYTVALSADFSEDAVASAADALCTEVNCSKTNASYSLTADRLTITAGTPGMTLDATSVREAIAERIRAADFSDLTLTGTLDEPDAPDVEAIFNEVHREPSDAHITAKSHKSYTVVRDVSGRSFDLEAARAAVTELAPGESCTLPLTVTPANVLYQDLSGKQYFMDVLATITSEFETSTPNRATNVTLAANACKSVLLNPGEEFSFNQVVGKRTTARGFKMASVFSGGEVVDGIGGGICQVSSAIYRAALLSELTILQRNQHRFSVPYAPYAQDATVVYGSIDFRFANSREDPIYLEVVVTGRSFTVTIYGTDTYKGTGKRTVELYTKVLSTTPFTTQTKKDATLAPGTSVVQQEGSEGAKAELYRIVSISGREISRELINTTDYKPCKRIVAVGPTP